MKLHSLLPSRMALTAACGVAFAAGIGAFHAKADAWDKKTILTVNQTIQVRNTVLEPGQYVLKLYNSNSERHIVQIFNADQSHLIDTVMAIPKQRMEATGDTQFQFWETPSGTARAMRAWFYPGDTVGQEFAYPKHLIALASAAPMPVPSIVTTQPQQPEMAPQPETLPQPQAVTRDRDVEDQPAQTQPVEIAQNSPPPPPEAPAPEVTEPQPSPQPAQELPKTGSLYPLMGISGGILLGIFGLLRLKRLA